MDEDIGLAEVIQSIFNYQMQDKFTALPGVVLRVINSSGQQLLDVQPCVSLRNRDGTVTQQAPILNVPYQQPASSVGGTVFPVAVGDNVLLVFQMRGIDTWKYGQGGLSAPSDYRMFSNQDCVAIPCISPVSKTPSMKNKHSGDYEIGDTLVFNGGTEIILKANGTTVVNSPSKVTVNSPNVEINATTVKINASSTVISGDLSVSGNTTVAGNLGVSGQGSIAGKDFITHTHSGVETGPGTTGGVS